MVRPFFRSPVSIARAECGSHPVAFVISAMLAPVGPRSSWRSLSLLLTFGADDLAAVLAFFVFAMWMVLVTGPAPCRPTTHSPVGCPIEAAAGLSPAAIHLNSNARFRNQVDSIRLGGPLTLLVVVF